MGSNVLLFQRLVNLDKLDVIFFLKLAAYFDV